MTSKDKLLPVTRERLEDESRLHIAKRAKVAGGPRAVLSATAISVEEMGLVNTLKTLTAVNQTSGFDCPGCAWPDPLDHRSVVEFCENGAKAVAEEATLKRVGREFFSRHSVADLVTRHEHWLGKQGRIAEPMVLRSGATHYEAISWDDAFAMIARELKATAPDRAVFYTSGRTSNEAAFLYQLFVRQLGTNNLPDCSNLCHESSGVALKETIGSGKGSVQLSDFALADCIIVIGQNPGTNHPRMLSTLQEAARRGCRIIAINPLLEAGLERFKHPQEVGGWIGGGTPLTTDYVQVKINGDLALLKGIMKEILTLEDAKPGTIDRSFVDRFTSGFAEFCADLRAESWEAIEESSGIARQQIAYLADVISKSKNLICCWAMGLTQHKNAVATIQEIVNLLLLGGHIGRPGAGACPVRGHSNVQGDRTMGIWEAPTADFLRRLGEEFNFDPPHRSGFHVVSAIQAMSRGEVDVFFAMGGNFLSASPDTDQTAAALRRTRLTVHVSTKLNRSHFITGNEALILPAIGRTEVIRASGGEQFVTVEDSMGVVRASRGNLRPASDQCMSEVEIVCRLAGDTLGAKTAGTPWGEFSQNYDLIRDRIERVIPGFDDFNRRVRDPYGFVLPHQARDSREFATETGKARFTVHEITPPLNGPGQFVLMTMRSHDQYNTTIYGLDDRYRGITHGRRVVFINPEDAEGLGLKLGDAVDLVSHYKGETRRVSSFKVVPYEIPRQCLASYFPETNPLVPLESYADRSHTPTSKSIVVTVERSTEGGSF